MKPTTLRPYFSGVSKSLLIAGFCAMLGWNASAVQRPVQHSLQGTVEAVDTSRHLIKIRTHGTNAEHAPQVQWVGYKMRTRVMNSKGQLLGMSDLKTGDLLRVTYRSHWSAHPQAEKIVTE